MSEDAIFCGVFDGHGPHGHLVARKVRDALPLKLLSFLNSSQSRSNVSSKTCFGGNVKKLDDGETEKDASPEEKLNLEWREAFMKSYKSMDKELRSHPNVDCFCSGSTAVTLVKQVRQEALPIFFCVFSFILLVLDFWFSIQGSNLFMGYIGDSRAILGSKDSSDSMIAIQLTVDLKPDLPSMDDNIFFLFQQCVSFLLFV